MRHFHKALLATTLGLCVSAAAHAQCKSPMFYADLKQGAVINEDPALFQVISPMTPSLLDTCRGWQEMVLQLNIPKDCTAVTLDADYEGTPVAWTLNIGDSPTNNGYAGDAGTTVHNAELWILDQTLALANAGNSPGVIDNPLIYDHLALTDSGLKFLVRDQYVSWGQPFQSVQSPVNKLLFALPDTTLDESQNAIYAGLNRVISGAPWNGRTGCGLRSVVIRFQ
jgi:hypothetical protein